jgi:hypothetical protein
MVMREVLLLSAVGCSIGVAAFLYGGRVLSTMLFDLTPTDPASLATGALVLICTAILAGLLPAYRLRLSTRPARSGTTEKTRNFTSSAHYATLHGASRGMRMHLASPAHSKLIRLATPNGAAFTNQHERIGR